MGVGQKRILTLDTDVAPKKCLVEQRVETRVSFSKLLKHSMRAKELVDEARDGDKVGLPAERVLQDILLTQHINLPRVLG